MTNEEKFQFLKEVKEVLDKAEIVFWIDFGTLLGFYREGGFLRGDPDIDIGMKREEQEKLINIIGKFEEIGEVITRVDSGEMGTHYLSGYIIIRDGFWVDIQFFWNCDGKWIAPISQWPKVMVWAEEYFNNLVDIEIKGLKFKMPEKIEEYLEIPHWL